MTPKMTRLVPAGTRITEGGHGSSAVSLPARPPVPAEGGPLAAQSQNYRKLLTPPPKQGSAKSDF